MATIIVRFLVAELGDEETTELKRQFGDDAEIIDIARFPRGIADIRETINCYQATVLEATIFPLDLLVECLNPTMLGRDDVRIIRAVRHNGVFSHFQRVLDVKVETEELMGVQAN